PGYDFSYPHDTVPSPGPYCGHGMACTGLIAANHTLASQKMSTPEYSGMISIDPHVKILPIKIFNNECNSTGVLISDLADAINYAWQHGADVLSNSWGYGFVPIDDISLAIDSAAIRGRSGKGCAVVFASGNVSGAMSWMAAHPRALGVGSCDSALQHFPYSGDGDSLDLVAPSGWLCDQGSIWSLDQEDNLGLNPDVTYLPGCSTITWNCGDWDFDCKFGGTSAATPIASGVAALVLARDPNMPRDSDTSDYSVYGVLRGSAVHGTVDVPDPEIGYGRVDAFRAILSIARGDANNNGVITISDILWISNYKFQGGPAPWPDSLLGDVNCTGDVTMADIQMLVDHLFINRNPLPLPCFEFND
ncbi:MAG: S8 family serine peptidase, partial [candidate division Zixibacteria bacterium]|nr:S8 family serine peptidase [candidate division Zixibacteria bacterium]